MHLKGNGEELGIPNSGKSPTWRKIKRTGGISRCRDECSSKLVYGKADQELIGPSKLWAQSPNIETPGWGVGSETSAPEVSPRLGLGMPGWELHTETLAPEVSPLAGGAGQSGKCLGGLETI